jgi:nucleotide-binding universal stress UspA family protein
MVGAVNVSGPILVAYDGSPASKAAIALAGHHLRPDREAIVLTVYEPLESAAFVAEAGVIVPPGADDQLGGEAERLANEGADLVRKTGFKATAIAGRSTKAVWETIVETVKEHNASLVLMGTHGRTGPSALLLGSVATAVMHHAGVPVAVVPAAFVDGDASG